MAPPFRAYEHLVRLAGRFLVGIALLLTARWLLVPSDYGRLGAYRASAITDNQTRPIVHAGQAACASCHSDVVDVRRSNAHERIGCEACHGPLATHAADPASPARKPDARAICSTCHTPDTAKPAFLKTVAFDEYADPGPC